MLFKSKSSIYLLMAALAGMANSAFTDEGRAQSLTNTHIKDHAGEINFIKEVQTHLSKSGKPMIMMHQDKFNADQILVVDKFNIDAKGSKYVDLAYYTKDDSVCFQYVSSASKVVFANVVKGYSYSIYNYCSSDVSIKDTTHGKVFSIKEVSEIKDVEDGHGARHQVLVFEDKVEK